MLISTLTASPWQGGLDLQCHADQTGLCSFFLFALFLSCTVCSPETNPIVLYSRPKPPFLREAYVHQWIIKGRRREEPEPTLILGRKLKAP